MRGVWWVCGLLVARLGLAVEPSLLDPPVSLNVVETELPEVVKELTAQTGVPFESPFGELTRPVAGRQLPEFMRAKVTLTTVDEPLKSVIKSLSEQTRIRFETLPGRLGYRLVPQPRQPGAEAQAPTIELGEYTVRLNGLRQERLRERYFGTMARTMVRDLLTAYLEVEATTELATLAVKGIENPSLSLDGAALDRPAEGPDAAARIVARPGPAGLATFPLTFTLPERDGRQVDRIAGQVILAEPAEELVFEFDHPDRADQRQTDGDIDVTLVGLASGPPNSGPRATVVVSRPAPPQPTRGGEPAAMRVEALAAAGQPIVWSPNGPIIAGRETTPLVALETKAGRRYLLGGANRMPSRTQISVKDGRLEIRLEGEFPPVEGEPAKLLVSVVRLGDGTRSLPFEFGEVELPGG